MHNQSDWNVRDHVPPGRFTVQSHRGAGRLMPENSLAAFALSWRLGAVPEADLRTTRDGVIVAFHDNDFRRLLPDAPEERRDRGVQDQTWGEVRALTLDAGFHLPSLAEVLDLLAGDSARRMYVDIKNVDLEQLARQARGAGAAERLILASTDHGILRRWGVLAPESSTLCWMGGAEAHLAGRLQVLGAENFRAVSQLQIHVRRNRAPGQEAFAPSSDFLLRAGRQLRRHGVLFQVLPYDIEDAPSLWRLLDLGVASFATDAPDVVMGAVRDYYALPRQPRSLP